MKPTLIPITLTVIALMSGGCATAPKVDLSQLTQTYAGAPRPAAEVAAVVPYRKDSGCYDNRLEKVDGKPIGPKGAAVLPGTHAFTIYASSWGHAIVELMGKPPYSGSMLPSGNDPRIDQIVRGQETRTRRIVTLNVAAGRTYRVLCDPATGANLRIE